MRLLLLFIACALVVVLLAALIGMFTGYTLGIFPVLILATLLTAFVNNRLESRRIKGELEKEGLGD